TPVRSSATWVVRMPLAGLSADSSGFATVKFADVALCTPLTATFTGPSIAVDGTCTLSDVPPDPDTLFTFPATRALFGPANVTVIAASVVPKPDPLTATIAPVGAALGTILPTDGGGGGGGLVFGVGSGPSGSPGGAWMTVSTPTPTPTPRSGLVTVTVRGDTS